MATDTKKGGRKPKLSGPYTVQNARRLFEQSKAIGKPDYRYVAIGIGANPIQPPDWAVIECINLRRQEERQAARGIDRDIPAILDELIRYYLEEEREYERQNKGKLGALDTYDAPSLRGAIITVLDRMGLRQQRGSKGNDDWIRDVRNAWNAEQADEPPPNADEWMRLEGSLKGRSGERMRIKPTARIHRVLMDTVGQEMGFPEDFQRWTWMAKRIADNHTVKSGDASASEGRAT